MPISDEGKQNDMSCDETNRLIIRYDSICGCVSLFVCGRKRKKTMISCWDEKNRTGRFLPTFELLITLSTIDTIANFF